jgi:hypothetical protein
MHGTINIKLIILDRFLKNLQISNFMKIRPMEGDLFHSDSTDRHDEANSHFSQFCERAQKTLLCGKAVKFRMKSTSFNSILSPCLQQPLHVSFRVNSVTVADSTHFNPQ